MSEAAAAVKWLRKQVNAADRNVWGTSAEWDAVQKVVPKFLLESYFMEFSNCDGFSKGRWAMRISDARIVLDALETALTKRVVQYLTNGRPA